MKKIIPIIILLLVIVALFTLKNGGTNKDLNQETGKPTSDKNETVTIDESSVSHKKEIKVKDTTNNENKQRTKEIEQTGKVFIAGKVIRQDGSPVPNTQITLQLGKQDEMKLFTLQDGSFSTEIEYKTNSTEGVRLAIYIHPINPVYGLDQLRDMPAAGRLRGLTTHNTFDESACFSKQKEFILQKEVEHIEVFFECLELAEVIFETHPDDQFMPMVQLLIPGTGMSEENRYLNVPFGRELQRMRNYPYDQKMKLMAPIGVEVIALAKKANSLDVREVIEPLASGETRYVTLNFQKGPLKFSGQCISSSGEPLENAHISASQKSMTTIITKTDSSGQFSIYVANEPLLTITAAHHEYKPKILKDVQSDEFLTFVLEKR